MRLETLNPETYPNEASKVRILLVEDNPHDVELIQRSLESELNCRVRVALTRASFESELEHEPPNIIVSDSNVLAFDGMTALKMASQKCPDIPFVFCTGQLSKSKKEEAIEMGAAGWVSKDPAFVQLACVVKRLLGFDYCFDIGSASQPPRLRELLHGRD